MELIAGEVMLGIRYALMVLGIIQMSVGWIREELMCIIYLLHCGIITYYSRF